MPTDWKTLQFADINEATCTLVLPSSTPGYRIVHDPLHLEVLRHFTTIYHIIMLDRVFHQITKDEVDAFKKYTDEESIRSIHPKTIQLKVRHSGSIPSPNMRPYKVEVTVTGFQKPVDFALCPPMSGMY